MLTPRRVLVSIEHSTVDCDFEDGRRVFLPGNKVTITWREAEGALEDSGGMVARTIIEERTFLGVHALAAFVEKAIEESKVG